MSPTKTFSLDDAIELGEYNPDFLVKYSEWKELTPHMQFEFIRRGIDNRRKHLRREYAAIINQLDFSKKPHLLSGLNKIVQAQKDLTEAEEKLQTEYAGK